jgi:hypothetical protein
VIDSDFEFGQVVVLATQAGDIRCVISGVDNVRKLLLVHLVFDHELVGLKDGRLLESSGGRKIFVYGSLCATIFPEQICSVEGIATPKYSLNTLLVESSEIKWSGNPAPDTQEEVSAALTLLDVIGAEFQDWIYSNNLPQLLDPEITRIEDESALIRTFLALINFRKLHISYRKYLMRDPNFQFIVEEARSRGIRLLNLLERVNVVGAAELSNEVIEMSTVSPGASNLQQWFQQGFDSIEIVTDNEQFEPDGGYYLGNGRFFRVRSQLSRKSSGVMAQQK